MWLKKTAMTEQDARNYFLSLISKKELVSH